MGKNVVGELGPSWQDVIELVGYLEAQHKCRIVVEMGRQGGPKPYLAVDVIAKRAKGRNDWYTCCYRVGRYPSYNHKGLPGLLLHLLWGLDEAITDYDDLPLLRDYMPEAELPLPPASE